MMRKIFGFLVVIAIAVMAMWNVNFSSKTNGFSDVMLANVEALAQSEFDDADCSDGVPRLMCRIWVVTYNFTKDEWTCTTGGEYKCVVEG
jgi:hypothetical protein